MSTSIGTAADYVDLLVRLDQYLCTTGHAWGKTYAGTGTGDLTNYIGTANSIAETFTITATGASTFTVVGTVSGALANATVGSQYTSARIAFLITAGGVPFQSGDTFTISTSPAWTRLLRRGFADVRSVSSDLLNVAFLFDYTSNLATRNATSCFVEWTMTAPTRVRRIYAQAGTNTRMPTTFLLQYKDAPGDQWTSVQTFTQAWVQSGEGATFVTTNDPGEHTYWRLEMSGATTSVEIREIRLFSHATASLLGDADLNGFFTAWRAPGLDGQKQIICMANTESVPASDIWNLAFTMSRTWTTGDNAFNVQPGWTGGSTKRMLLGTTAVGYWFIVNGQRAIVVTKFQGLMQVAYFGFGFAYEPPNVHAYPAIVAAPCGAGGYRFSAVNDGGIRNPFDPGDLGGTNSCSMVAYYPDSLWRLHSNRLSSNSTPEGSGRTATDNFPGKVWPAAYEDSVPFLSQIVANLDGSRTLIPCVLFTPGSTLVPSHHWGEFDGLYWTTGNGTAPEAVIRYENFDHVIVNNVFRTASHSFGAVRLD